MRVLRYFVIVGLAAAAGCYGTVGYDAYEPSDSSSLAVTVAPPEPLYETPPPAPYADAAWIGGYWDWNPSARRYIWIGGRWSRAPRAGVVYVPPRWERGRRGFIRGEGRWVPGQSVDRFGRHVWLDANGRAHYF
ncbi:MAG TPA: hypothetical protein VFF06_28055 [Polyangia bacterium]|nr:hypothetical protein [Polyangia bacterium]